MLKSFSYLALGDSYTIGEQVPLADSFPYQTVQLLRRNDPGTPNDPGVFLAPEIIAKTGWTTDELTSAIGQTFFLKEYDIVSLLIGVNNQYRGRTVDEFEKEFEVLLQMAIQFAGGKPQKVFVLSIPDWGVTPFAIDKEPGKIAAEIDAFNACCVRISQKLKTHFINITEDQRADAADQECLAPDHLHPSGKEYKKWAKKLSGLILKNLD